MITVYQILSGENWNGQTSHKDFAETKIIAEFETYAEFAESEYAEREDIIYEKDGD